MASLLPVVPLPLGERAALAAVSLDWPALREHVAGRAVSPLGRAWTRALEPSADLAWLTRQHGQVEEMRGFLERGGSFPFQGLFDPTGLLEKARIEGAALEGLEIASLLTVAERVAAWRNLVDPPLGQERQSWPAIEELSAGLLGYDLAPLLRTLRGKIEPDGGLSDDASPELRRIRRALERQHRAIEDSLRRAAARLKDEGAAADELIAIRNDRFVIPVKVEFKRRVPGVVHAASSSGQTVFIEPLETIEHNNELVRLLDEEQGEIHRILVALTRALGEHAGALELGCAVLAEVESCAARGRFAMDLGCAAPAFDPAEGARAETTADAGPPTLAKDQSLRSARPTALEDSREEGALALVEARHPLLELRMRGAGAEAGPVPLTIALPPGAKQLVISGPNTGGKTVSLKTLGLLTLMAQSGVPVPAAEARLPLFDAVYADIGDAQSIERNLSSFSAHVVNVDRISRVADGRSLVLLDELGSATDPEEGAALAVAVAEHFLGLRSWTAITTHLTSLKVYASTRPGVLNAAVGFDPETLSPTYRLRLGVPGASAGLNIAARLGMDPAIIAAARGQLTTQTADIGAFLDQLHDQLTAAAAERAGLEVREKELSREKARLEVEGRQEQKARTRELEAKLGALLAGVETELRETVKSIDDKTLSQKMARDAASRLSRARREYLEQFNSTVVAHRTGADRGATAGSGAATATKTPVPEIKPGDLVYLKSLGRQARVERVIDGKTVEVAIGAMKSRVDRGDIGAVETVRAVTPLEAARRRGGVTVHTSTPTDAEYMPSEINVIGRSAEEAASEVERFLDRAFLAGLPRIRVVHGTGMGILRRTLRELLRGHPHVAGIEEPAQNMGGQGATEVELRQ